MGDLLRELGRTYAPVQLANAHAVQQGENELHTTIDGKPWQQPTFPYQAKCLQWLNAEYQALDTGNQALVNAILADTGCETMIQSTGASS